MSLRLFEPRRVAWCFASLLVLTASVESLRHSALWLSLCLDVAGGAPAGDLVSTTLTRFVALEQALRFAQAVLGLLLFLRVGAPRGLEIVTGLLLVCPPPARLLYGVGGIWPILVFIVLTAAALAALLRSMLQRWRRRTFAAWLALVGFMLVPVGEGFVIPALTEAGSLLGWLGFLVAGLQLIAALRVTSPSG